MRAKRVFDIAISFCALLLMLPIFALVAIWIALDSPGPVFFLQERVGRFGKLFRMAKFRTMVSDAASRGGAVTVGRDHRITQAGQWLRRLKIDELPQLWNVFIGDMSLVGPRPEVPKFVALFQKEYDEILTVMPGITDYAAIQYRDEASVLARYADPEAAYISEVLPDKIALYKQYIRERSFCIDLSILLRTLCVIVK